MLTGFPFAADLDQLAKVEVVYETLPGWDSDITNCRTFEELPENCQKYVRFIENYLGVKIQASPLFVVDVERQSLTISPRLQWIGVGPARDSTIKLF